MLLASKKYIKLLVNINALGGINITPVVQIPLLKDTSRVIAQTVAISLRYRLKYERTTNKEGFAETYLLAQGWQVQQAD